jgi:MOSC domain-containing protein YiiM
MTYIGLTQAGGLEGLGTLWVSLQESSFQPVVGGRVPSGRRPTTGRRGCLWGRLHLPHAPLRKSYYKRNQMPKTGYVIQINVNRKGGVPKQPIASARITAKGVAGDKQRNRRFHGGPQRAVSLYSYEHIQALRAEGHLITPGSTGENLTIRGLDWASLNVGDQLQIGDRLRIEITEYAAPCNNIAASFADGAITRISQKLHPGWSRLYAKVLIEAEVRVGDSVVVVTSDE